MPDRVAAYSAALALLTLLAANDAAVNCAEPVDVDELELNKRVPTVSPDVTENSDASAIDASGSVVLWGAPPRGCREHLEVGFFAGRIERILTPRQRLTHVPTATDRGQWAAADEAPCSASTTSAARVASFENATGLPQKDRTRSFRFGARIQGP